MESERLSLYAHTLYTLLGHFIMGTSVYSFEANQQQVETVTSFPRHLVESEPKYLHGAT